MSIYISHRKPLQSILEDAVRGRLMIPNIQREYVWTPSQVVRIIDSLFRGWPYSTLLLWDTGHVRNHDELIPHHSFRKSFSRFKIQPQASPNQDQFFAGVDVPANIHMVLDGQQRIQSLLLAFGDHDCGLNLLDKDWGINDLNDEDDEPAYRGSAVNNRWLHGRLYVDISKLSEMVIRGVGAAMTLPTKDTDFTKILRWACPGEHNTFVSDGSRPDNYKWPIDKLWEMNVGAGKNKYIPAYHFWRSAQGYRHESAESQTLIINQLLQNQGANNIYDDNDKQNKLVYGIHELLLNLSFIREHEVTYYLLRNREEAGYNNDPEKYNEAIVNIFTRLNAGGLALDEEEITFAWLKNKWAVLLKENNAISRPDGDKIAKVLVEISETAKMSESQIIRMLSHIWVTFDGSTRNFRLLSARDLLNGRQIQDLAGWLFYEWDYIYNSIKAVHDSLNKVQFIHGQHYRSTNALFALVIYRLGFEKLLTAGGAVNNNMVSIQQQYVEDILKWLGNTILGGKWGKNSDEDMSKFITIMGSAWKNSVDLASWRSAFIGFIDKDTIKNAREYVFSGYDKDNKYTKARPIIAIWNHCDPSREQYFYETSEINRSSDATKISTIDHITPQKEWKNSKFVNFEQDINIIHSLGNLLELCRADNSAKNNRTIDRWLGDKKEVLNKIKEHYTISDIHASYLPNKKSNVERIIESINNRTILIKQNVIDFLNIETNAIKAEPAVTPATRKGRKPKIEPAAPPATKKGSKPKIEPVVTPATRKGRKPKIEPAAPPATRKGRKPKIEPIVTPATRKGRKPKIQSAAPPAPKKGHKSKIEPVVTPATKKGRKPKIEPIVTPATRKGPKPKIVQVVPPAKKKGPKEK